MREIISRWSFLHLCNKNLFMVFLLWNGFATAFQFRDFSYEEMTDSSLSLKSSFSIIEPASVLYGIPPSKDVISLFS
jgi:hypothetical protein